MRGPSVFNSSILARRSAMIASTSGSIAAVAPGAGAVLGATAVAGALVTAAGAAFGAAMGLGAILILPPPSMAPGDGAECGSACAMLVRTKLTASIIGAFHATA